MCVYSPRVPDDSRGQKRGAWFSGNGIMDDYELPFGAGTLIRSPAKTSPFRC